MPFCTCATTTGKQLSLRTKDQGEAETLLHVKNESFRQPILNLQIARTYMAASDPLVSKRTWQSPMDEMTRTKTGSTRIRHERAMLDTAFDNIRNLPIVETTSAHFLDALAASTVATNVFLRPVHPQVVGKSAGLPSRDLAKLAGCNEI
jgi:hypothetical protein